MSTIIWLLLIAVVALFVLGAISFTDKGLTFLKGIQAIIDTFFGRKNTPEDENKSN